MCALKDRVRNICSGVSLPAPMRAMRAAANAASDEADTGSKVSRSLAS